MIKGIYVEQLYVIRIIQLINYIVLRRIGR